MMHRLLGLRLPVSTAVRSMHIGHSHDTSGLARAWDFGRNGGLYTLEAAEEAKAFFDEWGFVVINEVMREPENQAVLEGLVEDLHEINPTTRHLKRPGDFPEASLPSSPNHSFRTTCNIVFGRFASMIRGHAGVREAFALLHGVEAAKLGVSWDTLFFTSEALQVDESMATQLHWDHNGYAGGEPHAIAEELCVQGVYYASETSAATPCFACAPGSHEAWATFSESDLNPSKAGDKLINYLPLTAFGDRWPAPLPEPVRIHVPARSLLLWDSRTCHGNSPPAERGDAAELGRVSLAISYGPVDQRTAEVQKDALVKALGAVRTTHHPAVMLSHDKQGYPVDWTAEAEYEPRHAQHGQGPLQDLKIEVNPVVTEHEFQEFIGRSFLDDESKRKLSATVNVGNVREMTYRSYWGLGGLVEEDCYGPMASLQMRDLRRLVHPQYSEVQGLHRLELEAGGAAW